MILKPTYMMSEVFMDCGQLLFGTDWHTNCGNGACSFADILISAMQRIIYRNIRVAVEYWNIPPPPPPVTEDGTGSHLINKGGSRRFYDIYQCATFRKIRRDQHP